MDEAQHQREVGEATALRYLKEGWYVLSFVYLILSERAVFFVLSLNMWADLQNWVHATRLGNTGWHKAPYVPPELLPRGKIHSSNVPNKMQLFDLCCFQDMLPWCVRTNPSFCLTALGKGWPLQLQGCPQQRCDVPFHQNWAKHKREQHNAGRLDLFHS